VAVSLGVVSLRKCITYGSTRSETATFCVTWKLLGSNEDRKEERNEGYDENSHEEEAERCRQIADARDQVEKP
jgi:hypothetical protein